MGNSYGYIPDGLDFYIVCCRSLPFSVYYVSFWLHRFLTREKVEKRAKKRSRLVNFAQFASNSQENGQLFLYLIGKCNGINNKCVNRGAWNFQEPSVKRHVAICARIFLWRRLPEQICILCAAAAATFSLESRSISPGHQTEREKSERERNFCFFVLYSFVGAWETTLKGRVRFATNDNSSSSPTIVETLVFCSCSWCGEFECADSFSFFLPSLTTTCRFLLLPGARASLRRCHRPSARPDRYIMIQVIQSHRKKERNLLENLPPFSRTLNSLLQENKKNTSLDFSKKREREAVGKKKGPRSRERREKERGKSSRSNTRGSSRKLFCKE